MHAQFLSTKVARRKAAAAEGNSAATTAVEDYVVSADVAQLERRAKEQDLDLVDTFVPTADGGLDVADWVAFEAILCVVICAALPRCGSSS